MTAGLVGSGVQQMAIAKNIDPNQSGLTPSEGFEVI
jgi:hypothetical protein